MLDKNKNQKVSEMSKIETVEDLEACYPQLVSKIKDRVVGEIEAWPVKKVRKKMPDLVRRIGAEIGHDEGPNMKVKGFLLEKFEPGEKGNQGLGDPFAQGTLRVYAELKNLGDLQLPFILPFDDVFSKKALESYVQRASGAGDKNRAEAAREAMKKCL